jgi:hypothetical protein
MKKVLIPVVGTLGAGVIVISGLANFSKTDPATTSSEPQQTSSADLQQTSSAPSSSSGKQENSMGLVGIQYRLHHLDRLASNQIAIWIEDERGNFVKTLFATSFTANGGYISRPESLPEWRKAANWKNASKATIERVARPEQPEGNHTVYWDCTDEAGKPVKPGTYSYKIEGNIQWENRVVFTGKIVIGSRENSANASAVYYPASAANKGILVEQVKADFLPGENMDASKEEPVTQTRGS